MRRDISPIQPLWNLLAKGNKAGLCVENTKWCVWSGCLSFRNCHPELEGLKSCSALPSSLTANRTGKFQLFLSFSILWSQTTLGSLPRICHLKIGGGKHSQLTLIQTNVCLTSALPWQYGSCRTKAYSIKTNLPPMAGKIQTCSERLRGTWQDLEK